MLHDREVQAAAQVVLARFPSLGIAWRAAIDPLFRAEVHRAARFEQAICRLRAVTGWDDATALRRTTWYARTEPLTVDEAADELADRILAGDPSLRFEDADAHAR